MSAKNSPFLDAFPKMQYDINNVRTFMTGSHDTVVDIFFRFGIFKSIVNNLSAYYVYEIQDIDTPEILAERVYGDAGAAWIIIYANNIVDPLFDWPLQYDSFQKMIISKYGSVATAQTTTHHYEKIITRVNTFFDTTSVTTFQINANAYPIATENNTYSVDGKTVKETITGQAISNYDYELKKNDDKRLIKVIKQQYYSAIMNEFRTITGTSPRYVRV